MSCDVYANTSEVACKASTCKVIASFPDVCLSPPSPPAGPIPIPYPDTSFAKDMMNGSKTVKIKGQEVMLKDQSFYKTMPLGDEAATQGLGAGVITHVITGKTYFRMWSMDVKFEGQNVDRHIDITTSNHASPIANAAVPNPNLGAMSVAADEDKDNKCRCCHKEKHAAGPAMTFDEFYGLNETDASGSPTPKALHRQAVTQKAMNREGCTCQSGGRVLPQAPCNVFRRVTKAEKNAIVSRHNNNAAKFRASQNFPESTEDVQNLLGVNQEEAQKFTQVNHLVPKTGGGCPTGNGNLQMHVDLCKACQALEAEFTEWQKEIPHLG
jgi:hypothetical protein